MAQGVPWDKEEVIRTLEPFFKLGCNVRKACDYAGIPQTTVDTWIQNDDTLRLKINAWRNEVNTKARQVLAKSIEEKQDAKSALEWLSRKEKDEFSTRTEHTGDEGGPIQVQGVEVTIRRHEG